MSEGPFAEVCDHTTAAKRLYDIQLGKMLQNESGSPADILVPYFKAKHVLWEGVISSDLPEMWASPRDLAKYEVRAGDLLVSEGGDVGRSSVLEASPTPAIIQNALHRVRSRTSDPRFFCYALRVIHGSGWLDVVCNKATIAHLTGEKLGELRIPSTPLPTQKAIAAFLDRKTAAIDALIEKKQKLLDLLAEKRAALINQAVTKGLDPNVPMKDSGIPWIGEIPAHWETLQVNHCLARITYGFTCPMPTTDIGPYMLTANDIRDGYIDFENARRTDARAAAQLTDKCLPRAGDVLLTKDGTLGRVAIADGSDACINQSVALLRANERLSYSYLSWMLRTSSYQDWMLFDAGGTTIKHIYITRLVKMTALVPPPGEQGDIVAEAARMDDLMQRTITGTADSVQRLQEYRQALITAAVTGQLDITDEAAA